MHLSNQASTKVKIPCGITLFGILLLFLVLAVSTTGLSQNKQNVNLELHGLNKAQRQQVLAYVDNVPKTEVENIQSFISEIEENATKSLQAIGHYQSTVLTKYSTYKSNTTVALHVQPGAPSRLRQIEINTTSDDEEHNVFKSEVRSLGLVKGQPFNHGIYEEAKASLLRTAQFLGYFDARFTRAQVLISKSESSADVFIEFNLGKRYQIDKVVYNQELYPENFLEKWQNFETTVPYRANYVRDLTVNLQSSGYFKRVQVAPNKQLAVGNNIPLIVDLEPAKENTVGIGVGFSKDTGARLKTNWLRPHTNRQGHTIEGNSSVSRLRKDLTASYRIPHKRYPSTNSYSIDLGMLNNSTDDTYSQLRTLQISDNRLTRRKWRRELSLSIENERFKVGDNKDKINLFLPGIGFSRVESTGGVNPTKGRYFSFQANAARRSLFSDINMTRATAAAKILNSWNNRNYLIGRAELGAVNTDSFDRLPPTHRFFAGGDNSVRGYSYQQISPKNDDGESTGGQYLTTGSLEYNRYITDKIALATFVDAGKAFNDNDSPTRVGVGVGLRWRSPVGPLRIDLAHGVDEQGSPYRVHLAIGPEL